MNDDSQSVIGDPPPLALNFTPRGSSLSKFQNRLDINPSSPNSLTSIASNVEFISCLNRSKMISDVVRATHASFAGKVWLSQSPPGVWRICGTQASYLTNLWSTEREKEVLDLRRRYTLWRPFLPATVRHVQLVFFVGSTFTRISTSNVTRLGESKKKKAEETGKIQSRIQFKRHHDAIYDARFFNSKWPMKTEGWKS